MATNAIETAKQERGSNFVFEQLIEKGRMPTVQDVIASDVYPNMPAEWYVVYQLQAEALKKYLGPRKGYAYSRDKGMMPIIESHATKLGVSTKDAWNPMDVLLTKKSLVTKIEKEVKKTTSVVELNNLMAKYLKSKEMIPISLKAIKNPKTAKNAILEEANMGGDQSGVMFEMVNGSMKCLLDYDERTGLLDTGELAYDFMIDGNECHVQARSFRYSIPSTGVQTDLTPKGRLSGAKIGKVSVAAMDPWLQSLGLQRPKGPSQNPNININGDFTNAQVSYWNNLYAKLKTKRIDGQKIKFGNPYVTPATIIMAAMENKTTRNVLGRLNSKLTVLEWLDIYTKIDQKGKWNEWLKTIYYGAKKEFSDENGPFIKIF